MMKFFIAALLTVLAMAMTAVSGGDGYSKQGEFNIIDLPEPRTDGGISVEKALKEGWWVHCFGNEAITLGEVS